MEQETICGFNIPKRELTEEEATREITIERFNEFHAIAVEDFCDQCEQEINRFITGGYLICKHPELATEILRTLNDKYGGLTSIWEVYADKLNDGNDIFYTDLAEFLNLTGKAKERVNQILIQVVEHYKKITHDKK